MKLQHIARRTGLPLRLIRYVVDHDLLEVFEEYDTGPTGQGRARELTEPAAVMATVAATLLHVGIRKDVVKSILVSLASGKTSTQTRLTGLFRDLSGSTSQVLLRYRGNNCVRLTSGRFDSGWLQTKDSSRSNVNVRMTLNLTQTMKDLLHDHRQHLGKSTLRSFVDNGKPLRQATMTVYRSKRKRPPAPTGQSRSRRKG
jgi:hypothetical protein